MGMYSLVPWAFFRDWPQSCPSARTDSLGGWSGACGRPRSSPSPGAGASCRGQKEGHPAGGAKRWRRKTDVRKWTWQWDGAIHRTYRTTGHTTNRAKRMTPQLHTSALRPSYFSPCKTQPPESPQQHYSLFKKGTKYHWEHGNTITAQKWNNSAAFSFISLCFPPN